jgi:hypothetical protein
MPKSYANLYNSWFKNIKKNEKLKQIGIILTDFSELEIINTIIQSNL